jgi:hypothetical protein
MTIETNGRDRPDRSLFLPWEGIKMGGANESTLQADKKKDEILRADERIEKKKKKKKSRSVEAVSFDVSEAIQTQNIRQHLSGGEVHFHDDDGDLKTAIPVAEWYNGIKTIRSMQLWQYVDAANQTIAVFQPSVRDGIADCVVSVREIEISDRLAALSEVATSK